MEPDYTVDARLMVETLAPSSALCIGPDCEAIFGSQQGVVKLAAGSGLPERLTSFHRFDFAFVSRTLEYLERKEALALLARLRDCLGGHFGLLVPMGEWPGHVTQWQESDLHALGLTLWGRYPRAYGELGLYVFNIANYKETPTWLNARYWAHPERWDQDWW
jgi:hypothetical protein